MTQPLPDRPRRWWAPQVPVTAAHAPGWKDRQRSSRALHRLADVLAHSATGLAATTLVVSWATVGLIYAFPPWWQTVLYSVTGSATFLMVFIIQHTQARHTSATQLKLDELIRASSRADDALIAIEESPAAHLQSLAEQTLAERDWS